MKNLTFKAAMLKDSRTTVNRRSTDGQSQRHCKQTPLSKRWKVLMTLVFLFTFAIGQMWGADLVLTGYKGGTTTTGSVKIHSNSDNITAICKFANSWSSGANFYSIKTTGGFKAGDVINFTGAVNTDKSDKNAKFDIYAANKSTKLYTSANNVVNGYSSADDPTPESYTLTSDQDSLLFARNGGTGLFLLTLSATRAGSDPEPTDVTAPAFVSSVPANSATDVAVSGNIVLTFSEAIASVDASKFTLTGATKGTVAIDGTDAKKVNVGYTAENNASVTLAVAADAVADAAGNKSAALSNISFTTVAAAPAPTCDGTGTIYSFKLKTNLTNGNVYSSTTGSDGAAWTTENYLQSLTGGTLKGKITSSFNQMQFYDKNAVGFTGGSNGSLIITTDCDIEAGYVLKINNTAAAGNKFTVAYKSGGSNKSVTVDGGLQKIVLEAVDNKTLTISRNSSTPKLTEVSIFVPYIVTLAAGEGATVTPTSIKAEANEVVALPHPVKDGYMFTGWYDGETPVSNAYTVTGDVTLTAHYSACPTSGTIYKFLLKSDLTNGGVGITSKTDVSSYLSVLSGGTLQAYASNADYLKVVGENSFSFENNNTYLQVDLDCELEAGDIIKSTTANKKFVVNKTASTSGATDITLGADKETTVPAALVGAKTLYIYRSGSNSPSPTISYFEIVRPVKYTVSFDANGGSGTMTALAYEADKEVTLPACTFTAPEKKEFDAWTSTDVTISDNKFTMPNKDVTIKATWKYLPKLTLEAGEGATGDAVVTYHKAGSSVAVPAKPTGFSNGTKEFTGWVYSSDVEITDGAFPMPSSDLTLTAQWASATAVVQIVGGDSYETFAAVIAAVTDGQTIQLLQDIDVDAQIEIAGVDVTIDLNGYKIEYTGTSTLPSGVILVHNGASLTINDSSDPDAGSIVSGDKAYAAVALTKLGDDASTPATLVVNGGALTGYYYGITGNGSRNNTVITINGGTITGTVGIAIYHPQVGTLTVNDGSLMGEDAAIEMRAGTLIINDGTFTATATEFSCNPNGSGSTTSGAAIAIAQHTTKKEISVTINGGTFNGVKALNESNPQVNDPAPEVAMEIKDGDFNGEVTTVDVNNFISGGTFDHEVAANQCAENYAPKDNGNGTYGVKPLATSIDFEGYYVDGSHGTVAEALAAHNYTLTADMSDNKKVAWDNNTNAYDKGLKIKEDAKTFSFEVAAGKLVAFKTGIISGATLSVNGGAAENLTITAKENASIKTRYYYDAAVQNFVFTTTTASYNIIKSVTIEDPYVVTFNANGGEDVTAMEFHGTALTLPSATKGTEVFKGWYDAAENGNLIGKAGESYTPTADVTLHAQWETVSTDNTLSALEVDYVALADFDPDKHIYNIVCEYGHTPKITLATATAAAQGATVAIVNTPVHYVDENNDFWYIQANVTPASGTPIGYNQVRYTNLPKQGATIFKAELTSATEATYSGLYADEANSEIKLSEDNQNNNEYKFSGTGNYIKIALQNATFAAGDVLKMTYSTNPQNGYLALYPSLDSPDSIVSAASPATTLVLPAGAEAYNTLYIRRTNKNNYNAWVTAVEVQRLMDPFIAELKVGDALATIDEEANPKTITIEVPASTDITALTPSIKAYANGGATVTPAEPQNFSAGAVEYTVTSYYDETTTYQVTVTKAEASHDATLSALSVAGYSLSPAFDPAVLTYNVELAKGTVIADLPAVSYTLNHAGAAAVKTNATVLPGATTIVVTAEDGLEENKKTYTINFTVSTSDIITIFDGSTMSDMATSPNGAISWEKVGSTMSAGDKNATYNNVTYTRSLSCGNSSTTKHFKIVIADNNTARIEVVGMSNSSDDTRHAWLTNSTEKGEYAAAIAGLETTGYNCADFTTDWLEEGAYYLHSDNTVNIFLIRVTSKAVAPKCQVPTITTQPATKLDFGAGAMTATVVASVEDGGTLKYQWYNAANNEAVAGATEATLSTTTEGTYYVVVTNTLAEHRDNSVKSAEAQLAHRVMNDATLSVLKYGETAIALEADKYEYRVDLEMGTTVVPTLSATATMAPYATVAITDATEFVEYEATSTVVVTAEDGISTQTYTVKFYVDHIYTALVPVTGSTTWNWKNAATEDATIDDVENKGTIIANYLSGANFEKIEGKANEKAFRNQNDGVYQGTHLHFNTTVPGKVKFYFRAPSSGEECVITVINNGKEIRVDSTGNSLKWSREVVVYGDVVIEMENKKEGKTDTRVQQIVFTEATPNYTRNVSNNIGTLCVDHNVLAGGFLGATFYQIASRNEQYNDKIDFEEVLPGEELKAGEPYIFKSNTGKIELFYGETEETTPQIVRGMHGVLTDGESIEITEENKRDIIYISQNDLYNCTNLTSLSLVKNRAYIVMSEVPTYADYHATQTNGAARRRVTLGMNSANVATGVEDVQGDHVQATKVLIDGQLYILRGKKMYDAKGQLVK